MVAGSAIASRVNDRLSLKEITRLWHSGSRFSTVFTEKALCFAAIQVALQLVGNSLVKYVHFTSSDILPARLG